MRELPRAHRPHPFCGVIKPHTTGFVGIMESLGELCVCAIVGFGYLASGEEQCAAPFGPFRGIALMGNCLRHAVQEDRSGTLSVYTVGIFVSLAAYITPMALLALTRAATRVQPNAGHCACAAARTALLSIPPILSSHHVPNPAPRSLLREEGGSSFVSMPECSPHRWAAERSRRDDRAIRPKDGRA